jgi:hypothetical protein
MSLKDPNYDEIFGIMGNDLYVTGHATAQDGSSFDFEADVKKFMIDIKEEAETDEKVLKFNANAKQFVPGTFTVELDNVKATESAVTAEMLTLVQSQVESLIRFEYDKLWEGDVKSLKTLPVESLMPVLMLKHLGSFANFMDVRKEHIEYGFDPDSTFGRKTPSARKQSMLKEVDSVFSVPVEGEDQAAIQLILDENLINTYLLEFAMIDTSMSLTHYLMMDPRTAPMVS